MNKTIIKEYEFLNAAKESIFFRTPFELFKDPLLRKLSPNAKNLYGIMLSRLSLAEKIGLTDENDNVYIVFSQDEIAEMLVLHVLLVFVLQNRT